MRPFSLRIRGKLVEYDHPTVMGILNLTPDSFYSDSRARSVEDVMRRVQEMVDGGADFIDVGAYSTRPGCEDIPVQEEIDRLGQGMEALRSIAPDIPVSVDTFRAEVARVAVTQLGVDMVNDISGGDLDPEMMETVAKLQVPYIIMHMRGTPQDMMQHCQYGDVTAEVLQELSRKVTALSLLGVNDVIIDPGFGFSKTLEQNYELMRHLSVFEELHLPLLVGISRKSMIFRLLDSTPADSLPGTIALNAYAIQHGASILRVHDVRPASDTIKIPPILPPKF
ncbi:MAG: dihydropteroate synthase [Bacteroidales bacterium]|nr:dihydropteroate synthase [Bacteroidales bacterium]